MIENSPVQSQAGAPDWLTIARDAFVGSTTYFDNSIRFEIEQDIRQFQSVFPMGSKYLSDTYRARSHFFRPKTRATIRKGEATAAEALFATEDVLSITPEDDEDQVQQASALVMKEIMQYRLTKTIPWFLTAIGAYQDAQSVGVCISYQSWECDPARGIDRPSIKLRPVENIRFDPASEWTDPINASPYLIDQVPMYVKDVRHRMNSPNAKTGEAVWIKCPDAEILQAVRSYSDSTRLTREGPKRTDSKDNITNLTDFTVVWIHKNIIEWEGQDWLYYTLGTTKVLSNPVLLSTQYRHGKRPYVMGFCALEAHRLYPGGISRLTRDAQQELNDNANQRSDNVKFAMNKRYFVKRGKRVDLRSLIRNIPSSVTLMDDPDSDVKVQETRDVTSTAYMEQDRLNLDFDDVAGVFSGSSVQSNRQLNETVGGLNLLSASANKVENYQLKTWVETWVEPVLRQLTLLEQAYETNDVILALAGRKAKLPQKFGIDTVTDELLDKELTLNVNIGQGTTSPQDQVNRFMFGLNTLREILADGALAKYGLQINEVIKEVFGKLGYKSGARFFNPDVDPMITMLENQVKDLQQKLEAKMPADLVAAEIKKIEAEINNIQANRVKSGVTASYEALQAAGVVAAVPETAPIADTIMKAAGYTEPTPAGVDPNLAVENGQQLPSAPPPIPEGAGMAPEELDGLQGEDGQVPENPGTHPNFPPPAPNADVGAQQGIQTPQPDGVRS